jgi:hypothetical protein
MINLTDATFDAEALHAPLPTLVGVGVVTTFVGEVTVSVTVVGFVGVVPT